MSIITAYKCDVTGKLFEDEKKYQKHVDAINRKLAHERKINESYKPDQQWWNDNFYNRVKSIAQLEAAILHHRAAFAANGVKNYSTNLRLLQLTPIIKFNKLSIAYREKVSNSHHCPHNGMTNFLMDSLKGPTSYPGWIGYIDYTVQSYKNQLYAYPGGSDMFRNTRIFTGNGSGGYHYDDPNHTQSFGYDIKLFASDWPAMANEYEKVKVYNIMRGYPDIDIDSIVNEWNPAENYFVNSQKIA